MKLTNLIPALLMVLAFGASAETVSVLGSESRTLTWTVLGPSGPRAILVTRTDTETLFKEGGPKIPGTLTTIYDPASGLVWH